MPAFAYRLEKVGMCYKMIDSHIRFPKKWVTYCNLLFTVLVCRNAMHNIYIYKHYAQVLPPCNRNFTRAMQ